MDLLLTHGYCLYEDPHERAVMKPYPPLGLLYLSSHLKAKGFDTSFVEGDDSAKPAAGAGGPGGAAKPGAAGAARPGLGKK